MPRQNRALVRIKISFAFILCLSAVSVSMAADLLVYAAASLTDAMKEIRTEYEKQSQDKAIFNFDGSPNLARQISEGAPADLFISADEAKMNLLQKRGLILKETRRSLLSNTLAIVAYKDNAPLLQSPQMLADPSVRKIALAEPQSVPAGIYAKEYLRKIGIWNKVKDRVVPTENVRAALAAVESGNVDFGIVYKTDAAISNKIKVVFEIPAAQGPKISYPLAVVKDSKNLEPAKSLWSYLQSENALNIFKKYGFIALPK